jgi:3-deoxy-D-manno-octulosonic-acid transferase
MGRSLGLAAYRALARRTETASYAPGAPRPKGELLWIHAAEPENHIALLDLAARLAAGRIGLSILITYPESAPLTPQQIARPGLRILGSPLPAEHPDAVRDFLDHWQPDLCLWTWGRLRPNLVLEAADRGCPMVLADADSGGFDGRRDRWLPDLTRRLLARFSEVIARSEAGRKRLGQLGLDKDRIRLSAPLMAGGQALHCAESDLTDLAAALGGRPVWFAAQLQPQEVPIVLAAHARAMRLSHRLLLILNTADPNEANDAANLAGLRGLTRLRWGDEGFPDETTQVMIADDPADKGLFFRVAPVSFIGSSLTEGEGGCDPFDAAALGSAVLYGPKVRRYLPSYSRLAAAGAARIVNDAEALGTAVSRLIAPDQAAAMAHAGWDVISQGAAVTDQICDLVFDMMDRERANA